jgi:predicted nucleic acid-binding protein
LIVYLETNFVLEIALARETEADARRILELAEAGEVQLVIPVFSLCEPYGTVSYRARKRGSAFAEVGRQLQDLGRGEANRELVEVMRPRVADIVEIDVRERTVLEEVIGRVLRCATVLPFSTEEFDVAAEAQATHGLDPADALIYAAVLVDARRREGTERKTFITRNSNDFDRASIREELDAAGCTVGFVFEIGEEGE